MKNVLLFSVANCHQLLLSKRELYDVSKTGEQCDQCISFRKKHCWDHKSDGSGSWTTSYCCSLSDTICDDLSFCSTQVSDERLQHFTCAADYTNCPVGANAEIRTKDVGTAILKKKSWAAYKVREDTWCKYSLKHGGSLTSDRFKFNKMNLKVISMGDTEAYLMKMPNG
jgi:hypothetical protein